MDGALESFDTSLASGHPKINWSTAVSFSQTAEDQPVDITTPATPGPHIQMPASPSALSPATGTLQVAQLTASRPRPRCDPRSARLAQSLALPTRQRQRWARVS
jgi:hypothetical protein